MSETFLTYRPIGVIRSDLLIDASRNGWQDERVHSFCRDENIPVLLEIPDDRRIAEVYSEGKLIVEALPEYNVLFESLLEKTMVGKNAGGEP